MIFSIPTKQKRGSYLIVSLLVCLLIQNKIVAQATSVRTGVTFQWEDTQANPNNPATISSVTINGEIYSAFAAPSTYAMTRLGPDGHNPNKIIENGTYRSNNSANANWPVKALAAFQDKNLNHYFLANPNGRDICGDFSAIATTDSQIQSLFYSPGIPSNDGGLIAITERNANNCYYISVYGTPVGGGPEQFLGDTFVRENPADQWGPLFNAPPVDVDYWNSGRVLENNGTIGIALFTLNDLAPVGSVITRVDLTAATRDHGDGKLFILQQYAVPKIETGCIDKEYEGTVGGTSNIPVGSTITVISGPTPAGQSFTFNPDGSYVYRPTPGFSGDVVFEYEICLPAPNTGVCDSATVTLEYEEDCDCFSGNADGPLLQN
ncbi:Ig-like domain-containing protein [Ulvibacter antarcticus]|uniref:VCBS repeat-containing protein n=1 Tax=Ulvibacter antarcticus TaxID=442714 RepID=A0A3L9YQC3_9FLAO|nr:Ig-like domain-containing protein [Ulvibacter antarcticus]RMA56692.1 hypothetical protein BXY75_3198 [Ulvibacter antarcticus]